MVRILPAEQLGQWVLFIAGTSLLEKIRSGLFQSAFMHLAAALEGRPRLQLQSSTFWAGGLLSVLLILLIAGLSVLGQFPPTFSAFFDFFPWVFACTFPVYFSFWVKFAERDFLTVLWLRLAVFGGFFFFLLGAYLRYYEGSLYAIALCYGTLHLGAGLVAFIGGKVAWPKLPANKDQIVQLLRYGRYSLGSNLSDHLLKSVDSFMIGYAFSGKEVAIYYLPVKIVEGFEIVSRSIAISIFSPLSTFFHQGKMNRWRYEWHLYAGLLSMGVGVLVGFLLLVSQPLIDLLGSGNYPEALPLLWLMLVAHLFIGVFRMTDTGLETIGKPELVLRKNLWLLLLNVVGNAIAIYRFESLVGVVMVSISIFGIGSLVGWLNLKKATHVSARQFIWLPIRFAAQKLKQFGLTKP